MAKKKSDERYIRSNGLLEKQVTINGKRKMFRGMSERAINKKIAAYKGEIEKGQPFKDIAEEWQRAHYPTLSFTTQLGYDPSYDRAIDKLGDIPIKQITAMDIKEHLNLLNAQRRSQKVIRTQLLIYSLIFSYAAEQGYIEHNIVLNVSMPKHIITPVRRQAATEEDEELIKGYVKTWLLPYFLLYTGMRKGEALAIQFRDIDRTAETISVSKSVYYEINKPKIKEPKTASGIRTIPILEPLKKHLPKGNANHYLFSTDGGETPLTKSEFQRRWEKFKRETGATCTAHQLRHSYATLLFDADISSKDAQDLLGHATESMTRDIYTHIRESRHEKTTSKLNDFLKNRG